MIKIEKDWLLTTFPCMYNSYDRKLKSYYPCKSKPTNIILPGRYVACISHYRKYLRAVEAMKVTEG